MARTLHFVLALFVVCVPALFTIVFVTFAIDVDLSDFVPNSSDEIMYWHQINTFREAGFNGGYYTINEVPPNAAFTHFYTKGPVFPMFYGTIGRLVGWHTNSSVALNLIMITAALAVFVYVTRLNIRQLIALGLLLGTSWALLLYLPRIMQEGLQNIFAILFAALFYRMLRQRVSFAFIVGVAALILAVSFFRGLTWALLLIPAFGVYVLKTHGLSLPAVVVSAGAAVILIGLAFVGFLQISLPESSFVSSLEEGGMYSFGSKLAENVQSVSVGRTLEVSQRYQVLFVLGTTGLAALVLVIRTIRVGDGLKPSPTIGVLAEYAFHVLNLGTILGAILLLYDMSAWRDYRLLAPHLLLSLLLLIAFRRYWLVAAVILSAVLMYPKFREEYKVNNYTFPHEQIAAFGDAVDDYLIYDPTQTNAWCNTLLLHGSYLINAELVGVPAGIGISVLRTVDTVPNTLYSRYFLIDNNIYQGYQGTLDTLNLELLTQTPTMGDLYVNYDADCK